MALINRETRELIEKGYFTFISGSHEYQINMKDDDPIIMIAKKGNEDVGYLNAGTYMDFDYPCDVYDNETEKSYALDWAYKLGKMLYPIGDFPDASSEWGLYVKEEHQNRGVGRSLFVPALDIAKNNIENNGDSHPERPFFAVIEPRDNFYGRYFANIEDGSYSPIQGAISIFTRASDSYILFFPDYDIPLI